jgi:gamma-glutamyltranspeptidase / glutathione hydrolase
LQQYHAIERVPLVGRYREWTIIAPPLPSSGGTVLIESLNILRHLPWERADRVDAIHYTVEAMRWAYRDRAQYLGDVDPAQVPAARLLSNAYALNIAERIHRDRATPSQALPPATDPTRSADNTTHFSIVDAQGNRVSATLSINYPFGAAHVVPGTGLLLNDEMDDFAPPGQQANGYGLVGSSANQIASGKRPLSSMTPTFLVSSRGVAVLGTPGGSRIISMVLLGAQAVIRGDDVAQWVGLPRFHHQYLPDEIQFEPNALSDAEQQALAQRGHALKLLERPYGNMQAIWWERQTGRLHAASDPRGIGAARAEALRLSP